MSLYQLTFALVVICITGCKPPHLSFKNERFGSIDVTANRLHPTKTAMFFSDSSKESSEVKSSLLDEGFLVATIDVDAYIKSISTDSGDCSYLAGEIERLSQTVQNEAKISEYQKPVLVGVGKGATLAFAILAESSSSFLGAVTVSFCPELSLPIPLCAGDALLSSKTPNSHLITVAPSDVLSRQWIDHEFNGQSACPSASISDLIKKTPNAQFVTFSENWKKEFGDSVRAVGSFEEVADPHAPLKDLPLVVSQPEKITSSYFVIFFSGDGGWAWIDKGIAKVLNDQGIPVVGVNSLKYFWKKKSAQAVANDIKRIIAAYVNIFHVQNASLMGFSLGAEILPGSYNRLSSFARDRIVSIGMISPGTTTSFEVLIGDWVGVSDESSGVAIGPEVKKITEIPIACIAGDDKDEQSVCKDAHQANFHSLLLPGGHHFSGNYEEVGKTLIKLLSHP